MSYAGAWASFSRTGRAPEVKRFLQELLVRELVFCGLTPELSRPAERDRRWFNHSASAETAKRARLERIVRPRLEVPLSKVCEREEGLARVRLRRRGSWHVLLQGSSCHLDRLTPRVRRRHLVRRLPRSKLDRSHSLRVRQASCSCNRGSAAGDPGF